MGIIEDAGRIWDVSKKQNRPGFAEGLSQAASAAEAAQAMKEQMAANGGVPQGVNGQSFNPFENMAAMQTATRGQGTVTKLVDTGEKFDTASIYEVTFHVVSDTAPPFDVVHKQMIAAAALGNWQVGKMLPVRFDPANPTQVTIG
ncbi:MAG TPA: hypothetical protein VGO65_05910 [Pseudolysinimonas sp.]|nr:hypothetical protein [Schumannella sp.]HEV7741935.1 hypothetical protein [Pseudolysinimonas sp.]